MEIQQLRYVVEVARQGSFSAAAKNLFVSQSAMSQQIQKLENDLGFQLFYRSTRSVGTTDAGILFCRYAEKVIKAYDDLENGMAEYRFHMNHSLAILYMSMLKYTGITRVLSEYYAENPGISFSTADCAEGDLEYKMRYNHWDVLLLRDSDFPSFLRSDDFYSDTVLKDPLGILCSKDHPLAGRVSVTNADLKNEAVIYGPKDYLASRQSKDSSDAAADPAALPGVSEDVAVELVRGGKGLAVVPGSSMETEDLMWIPLTPAKYNNICLVCAKEKLKYEVVSKFISYIKESYK